YCQLGPNLPFCGLGGPRAVVLPVRSTFGGGPERNIPLCAAREGPRLVWPLADCLVSKFQTGREPKIVAAIGFQPRRQRKLKPTSIRGSRSIDPNVEDFFQRMIEEREAARALAEPEKSRTRLALKLTANGTGYGMWNELDVNDAAPKSRPIPVVGHSVVNIEGKVARFEEPGRYYCPPIATFITSGARLLLALIVHEVERAGSVYAFLDTD